MTKKVLISHKELCELLAITHDMKKGSLYSDHEINKWFEEQIDMAPALIAMQVVFKVLEKVLEVVNIGNWEEEKVNEK